MLRIIMYNAGIPSVPVGRKSKADPSSKYLFENSVILV